MSGGNSFDIAGDTADDVADDTTDDVAGHGALPFRERRVIELWDVLPQRLELLFEGRLPGIGKSGPASPRRHRQEPIRFEIPLPTFEQVPVIETLWTIRLETSDKELLTRFSVDASISGSAFFDENATASAEDTSLHSTNSLSKFPHEFVKSFPPEFPQPGGGSVSLIQLNLAKLENLIRMVALLPPSTTLSHSDLRRWHSHWGKHWWEIKKETDALISTYQAIDFGDAARSATNNSQTGRPGAPDGILGRFPIDTSLKITPLPSPLSPGGTFSASPARSFSKSPQAPMIPEGSGALLPPVIAYLDSVDPTRQGRGLPGDARIFVAALQQLELSHRNVIENLGLTASDRRIRESVSFSTRPTAIWRMSHSEHDAFLFGGSPGSLKSLAIVSQPIPSRFFESVPFHYGIWAIVLLLASLTVADTPVRRLYRRFAHFWGISIGILLWAIFPRSVLGAILLALTFLAMLSSPWRKSERHEEKIVARWNG